MAGDRVFDTLAAKRRYVHERLEHKYRKVLGAPQWEPDEIDRLGPAMRQYVVAAQSLSQLIRARLRWTGNTRYGSAA